MLCSIHMSQIKVSTIYLNHKLNTGHTHSSVNDLPRKEALRYMYISAVKQICNKFCSHKVTEKVFSFTLLLYTEAPKPCSATKHLSACSHQSELPYRKASSPAPSQDNVHQPGKKQKKPPACLGYPNTQQAKRDHADNSESKTADQIKEVMGKSSKKVSQKRHVEGRCR